MRTTIADEIRRDPVLGQVVHRADEGLRKLLDGVQQPPAANWRPGSLAPTVPPSVELELIDEGDSVAREFRVDQLTDERDFRFAALDLWGELIMLAYGRSNERLLGALRELRKDEEQRELQAQGA